MRDFALRIAGHLRTAPPPMSPDRSAAWTSAGEGHVNVHLSDSEARVDHCVRGANTEVARFPRAEAETLSGAPLEAIKAKLSRAADVAVVLPPHEALRRALMLPAAAAGNLRGILRHELDRQSPIDPAKVYFDYVVKDRDKGANKLDVELRIVKRDSIERAIALCHSLGLEPVSIGIEGDVFPLNRATLPLNRAAVLWALWRRSCMPVLSALVLVLAIAVLTAALARTELAASELEDRVADARAKAAEVQKLRDEITEMRRRSALLAQQKRALLAVQVLAELSRTLPDGTWIYAFQLNGRDVRIRGFSPSASTLIGLFDTSELFASAQFRAPLTQAEQTELERFDLSFEIEGKKL